MSDKIIGLRSLAACPNIIQPQFFSIRLSFSLSVSSSLAQCRRRPEQHISSTDFSKLFPTSWLHTHPHQHHHSARRIYYYKEAQHMLLQSSKQQQLQLQPCSEAHSSFSVAASRLCCPIHHFYYYQSTKEAPAFSEESPFDFFGFFKLERKNGPCVCWLLEELFLQQILNDVSDQHIHPHGDNRL